MYQLQEKVLYWSLFTYSQDYLILSDVASSTSSQKASAVTKSAAPIANQERYDMHSFLT